MVIPVSETNYNLILNYNNTMNILDYILIHFTQRELELYRQRNFENKTYDELKKTL